MPVLIATQPVAHIWNLCYGYRRNVVRKPAPGGHTPRTSNCHYSDFRCAEEEDDDESKP